MKRAPLTAAALLAAPLAAQVTITGVTTLAPAGTVILDIPVNPRRLPR